MRHKWTEPEVSTLIELYPHKSTASIAEQLGLSMSSVYDKAGSLGLKKSDEYLASPSACRLRKGDNIGQQHRFKKGQPAWNKGMKGLCLGGKETRFKKGILHGRAKELLRPIGAERVSKDGYIELKVNNDLPMHKRWRAVHIINWEAVNGQLPAGHALVFKDGNKKNAVLENLELIDRAELMRRNSYRTNYPKEVAQLIHLRGALQRQLNKRTRNEQRHQRTENSPV